MSDARSQGSVPLVTEIAKDDPERLPGLTLFLVDEAVSRGGLLARTIARLEQLECGLLATKELGPEERHRIEKQCTRDRDFLPGTAPATVLVMQDLAAVDGQGVSGGADGERQSVLEARINRFLRQRLPSGLAQGRKGSFVHVSRNSQEAWQNVLIALPEQADTLLAEARRRAKAYRTPFPVVRRLTPHVNRAKVELVDYHGTPAVYKTFRIGNERFLQREVLAHVELSRQLEQIPRALAYGENWILLPFIEDMLGSAFRQLRLLPLPMAKQLIRFLEALYDAGYAHLDFSLKNALFDRAGQLRVIDFEFLHRYDKRPASFEESYDITGPPADFAGDLPKGSIIRTYDSRLRKNIGLSLKSLREDPDWKQHMTRSLFFATTSLPRRIAWQGYRWWLRLQARSG